MLLKSLSHELLLSALERKQLKSIFEIDSPVSLLFFLSGNWFPVPPHTHTHAAYSTLQDRSLNGHFDHNTQNATRPPDSHSDNRAMFNDAITEDDQRVRGQNADKCRQERKSAISTSLLVARRQIRT